MVVMMVVLVWSWFVHTDGGAMVIQWDGRVMDGNGG